MRIAVTGSHGLVGSALVPFLETAGHQVQRIGRRKDWELDLAGLDAAGAVVHLAGENIAAGRWSASKKERILRSRTESTAALVRHLAGMKHPPRVLVCASAIGIYGDRGPELLDETSPAGSGFLAEVCRAWEKAAAAASAGGTRVVSLRFGMILSSEGGALARMLRPFRLGLGGRIGNGSQYLSWIGIDDAAGAILYAIGQESLAGPVNAVAPEPLTNRDFTRRLGKVLHRPALFPLPAFAARLAFGEMADALLLCSTRVVPSRLLQSGYRFRDPDLKEALHRILGR